ncbi:integrase, catalytic region, zinc finger, CCHC-type containing protein, partial [Tanacetum coccineum]
MQCVTMPTVKPKVLAPETLCEIVEEVRIEKPLDNALGKIEKPLDNALGNACFYTKRSHKLLEYVIGTCPKEFSKRDKKVATTHLNRKKQVAFKEPYDNSNNNTQTHVEQLKSKTKILPAKSNNKKKVEAHPRNNKSKLKQENRVDYSISSKLCCEIFEVCECLLVKDVLSTVKQVWKETGKLFVNVGYQWKPTRRKFTLGEQCPLTRTPTEIRDPNYQTLHLCLFSNAGRTDRPLVFGLRLLKIYDGNRSRLKNFIKKFIGTVRFENDHFGAIMGYGDYVIGDSVISMVYYVEGLGHNHFSVGQFCDSDLEVAFRKHSCYDRNEDGLDLLKGSRGSNLYTISVEDMMKSSPICLLSKASKNKSWLWHRRLNHLNFGTINVLARKDLVRGLPRLKFEKDH